MSYGSLVSIESSFEVDTSNLDERLDSMQETIDGLDGMSEEKVNDLIDSEISSRDLVSTSDYDLEDMQRRVERHRLARRAPRTSWRTRLPRTAPSRCWRSASRSSKANRPRSRTRAWKTA